MNILALINLVVIHPIQVEPHFVQPSSYPPKLISKVTKRHSCDALPVVTQIFN